MTSLDSKDAEAKRRIISHMNRDHHESVVRYTEHFGHASRFTSRNALLTDITLDRLTIAAGGRTFPIPLQPPMASLSEARQRLVKMDQDAITGLSRSSVTIKTYQAPKGAQWVVFLTFLISYILLSRGENIAPGSLSYELVLKKLPRLAKLLQTYRTMILYPIVGAHSLEAVLMARRLKKHSVPLFSRVWWSWTVSTIIEGVGAFQRTNDIIKAEKDAKEKARH